MYYIWIIHYVEFSGIKYEYVDVAHINEFEYQNVTYCVCRT